MTLLTRSKKLLIPFENTSLSLFSKLKTWLILFFGLAYACGLAQNEDKIWYFGRSGVGLDFRNCSPVVRTDGYSPANTLEGAVTICDAVTGRMLFYSSGSYLIDSIFNVMPNGTNVGSGTSLTQQVIVKKPGSANIFYYIVTEMQGGKLGYINQNARGIKYAIIDMTLNSGKGDVVTAHIPIKDSVNCEKLCIVKHSNGTDYWLLAHEYGNNNFLVYSITASGINITASTLSIGPAVGVIPDNNRLDAIGELKASPDGSRLAFTSLWSAATAVFNFNKSTGVISNPVSLSLGANYGGYGVSFSPDNSKLYISCLDLTQLNQTRNSEIVQFDLSSNNAAAIQASKYTVHHRDSASYRSLKLGPDGRIYCARVAQVLPATNYENLSLGIINQPNNAGAACNYVHAGIYLQGQPASWGLNNQAESSVFCCAAPQLSVASSASVICAGTQVTLTASGASSYSWSNGALTATISVTPPVTTIYTITAMGSTTCSSKSSVTVNVSNCTGIENEMKTLMDVRPNPFSDHFQVVTAIPAGTPMAFKFTDTRGADLSQRLVDDTNTGSHVFKCAGSELEAGIYQLQIFYEGTVIIRRLVKN